MRILIAEDDVPSMTVLRTILVRWGHEVVSAEDGVKALRIMQQDDAPKLAILDWMMPHLDGLEVCRRLRADKKGNPPYIIILSAKNEKTDIIKGLEAGADDYLVKPVDHGELRSRIEVGSRMIELQSTLIDKNKQLRESRHFLDNILNSVQDGISVLDKDLNILMVNEVMNDWYKEKLPLENKKCYQAYHDRTAPCPDCPSLRSISYGQKESAIVQDMRGSQANWLEIFSYPNVDHDTGQCIGVVEFVRDITHQRKLQAQLTQAQKMESVGNLAGGMAHDFNNLLQVMGSSIELLKQGKSLDHPDTPRLGEVAKAIDRAAQLIQQLLLFARRTEPRKMRVNLNREVEGIMRILQRILPKMIALELHLDRSAWQLVADPVQIEQILLNLATNAADAMPEGGKLAITTCNVVLEEDFVRCHPGSSTGRHVLLTFTDTGCGMDKKVLEHVFDPFFTTKEAGRGTGLGLASVYGIVKSHGGSIQCYSEPGLGTTFRIYWPAAKRMELSEDGPVPEAAPLVGDETILVADDEQVLREITREVLETLGYTVLSAANGEEALQIYREQKQDIALVLLDLNMPGMGGRGCLERLLGLDSTVRVVVASGYMADGQGRELMSSGAKGFIGKPYQLRELAATIRSVLDEKDQVL